VAVDKFTKWIEVKSVTCPKADRVLDFLDELVHRYRLPHRIITDLASNFNNHQFWKYCENSGIDFLVYGSEAILPAEVMWDSPAVEQYDEGISEDIRQVDIDGLEEAHCASLVQSARYLDGIQRYHDCNVKECSFNVGDLVLRCIQNMEGLHKLSSPWEGPFIVAKVTGLGSYRLQTLEGEDVSNSWNIDQLCRFYA
jgi:hypothetical protein